MASIKKRDNGKWRARYRDDAGKEHARHFDRKVDAQRWLDEVTASVVSGTYVDPRAGTETVKQYAERWQAAQVGAVASLSVRDNAIRVHLVPALGARPLRAVRHSEIQAFARRLEAGGLSPASVRTVVTVVSAIFRSAVKDRMIAVSPCDDVRLPRVSRTDVVPPTVDQVQAVRDALEPRWQAAVTALAGSGLRIGELLGLQISDVDFLRRTIRVERQRLQSGELAPPKSASSIRTVPVGQVTIDALAAHLAAYPSSGALFVDELGEPLKYRRWKSLLSEAAEAAGADLSSHDLRHFAASALISGGASVKQVQAFLGHHDATITLRTYAHLWPGDEDRTRAVLDAALAPLADSLRTAEASDG